MRRHYSLPSSAVLRSCCIRVRSGAFCVFHLFACQSSLLHLLFRITSYLFGIHTGVTKGKSNKRISMKNVIFLHDFHEKSPFSRTICNETKCRILIECLIAADISNLRKTDIFVKATAKPFGSFSPLSGSQTDGGLPILRKFA